LIAVGAILGWLASVITQINSQHGILVNLATGVAGALISGLFIQSDPIFGGITADALLVGVIGSIAVLAFTNTVLKDAIR
jgi:uncharacterized membrane protein YeaQ/YmgE (transglycosylase-associated protein family)